MEPKLFCQSCTMPIDKIEEGGTEKNGSVSNLYCKYCYQNGVFTNPAMTLEQMKSMAVTTMQKQQVPDYIIQRSINMLPTLKRWSE
jgi:Putative zinc ribbon domain